jgi:hypothetical protein
MLCIAIATSLQATNEPSVALEQPVHARIVRSENVSSWHNAESRDVRFRADYQGHSGRETASPDYEYTPY